LAEISLGSLAQAGIDALRSAAAWGKRDGVLKELERELRSTAIKTVENRNALASSLNEVPREVAALLKDKSRRILILDIPMRSIGTGGTPPPILKDVFRKRGEYSAEEESRMELGHIWREGMEKMMAEISMCRIYCEPDFYSLVTSVLEQSAIDQIVGEKIPGWRAK
jgi:hypothetical protein